MQFSLQVSELPDSANFAVPSEPFLCLVSWDPVGVNGDHVPCGYQFELLCVMFFTATFHDVPLFLGDGSGLADWILDKVVLPHAGAARDSIE